MFLKCLCEYGGWVAGQQLSDMEDEPGQLSGSEWTDI